MSIKVLLYSLFHTPVKYAKLYESEDSKNIYNTTQCVWSTDKVWIYKDGKIIGKKLMDLCRTEIIRKEL